jgi:hypothetical protein
VTLFFYVTGDVLLSHTQKLSLSFIPYTTEMDHKLQVCRDDVSPGACERRNCHFYHPNTVCKYFPRCRDGNGCRFKHPTDSTAARAECGRGRRESRAERLAKNQKMLYHQTSPSIAGLIISSQSFRPGKATCIAGSGIYFARTPSETEGKAHNGGVVLSAIVSLGNVKTISPDGDPSITYEGLLAEGYDSVMIPRRGGRPEWVVYNEDQVHTVRMVSLGQHNSDEDQPPPDFVRRDPRHAHAFTTGGPDRASDIAGLASAYNRPGTGSYCEDKLSPEEVEALRGMDPDAQLELLNFVRAGHGMNPIRKR